jgi:NAD(P)-dependent dehydrogenase (short-subunit alcohol dehydrogenase family)
MNFVEYVVLITGGGRGLGRAFAQALAQSGASVAITARSTQQIDETAQLIQQAGGRALAIAADVTDRRAVEQLVDEVEKQLGPIGLLINAAGSFQALGPAAEIDPDEWWREVEINVRGTYLCSRAVLPHMIARSRGRIINVASAAGIQALDTVSAYGVSKTAVIRLSECLANENREHGISVFAINPGTVRTPMSDYVVESAEVGRRAPWVQAWFRDLYEKGHDMPIERSVRLILQLAAGKFDVLSGCYLYVEDDLDDLVKRADEIQQNKWYTLRLSEPPQPANNLEYEGSDQTA